MMIRGEPFKTVLTDNERKYLDENAKLLRDFCTRYCCQIETVPFINGETFPEAFEDGKFSAVFMEIYSPHGHSGSTSAATKIYNGIGLTAIAAAAEKYGGPAQTSNKGKEFF